MIECARCGTLYDLDATGCNWCGTAKSRVPKIIPPEQELLASAAPAAVKPAASHAGRLSAVDDRTLAVIDHVARAG